MVGSEEDWFWGVPSGDKIDRTRQVVRGGRSEAERGVRRCRGNTRWIAQVLEGLARLDGKLYADSPSLSGTTTVPVHLPPLPLSTTSTNNPRSATKTNDPKLRDNDIGFTIDPVE